MSSSFLPSLEKDPSGKIAIVRFNNPAERNPLTSQTIERLHEILNDLFKDNENRSIIFTGSGHSFLSGAHIRELRELDHKTALLFSQAGQALMERIEEASVLTIAAINGFCMGGGLDFALACKFRICSAAATFAHPGTKLGIITGWGGTQRLPRLIGRARAIQLFTTAQVLSSAEALSFGLVSEVIDPVVERAVEIAVGLNSTS